MSLLLMGAGGAGVPWYLAGGILAANCVAAYKPKGAASLAASYVNLANPGTNDAAPGVAPTFDTATGWTFGGTQYLLNGVVPLTNQTWSAIAQYTMPGRNDGDLFGVYDGTRFFSIAPYTSSGAAAFYNNGNYAQIGSGNASGIVAIARNKAYVNGLPLTGTIGTLAGTNTTAMWVGGRNSDSKFVGALAALAVYNTPISPFQVYQITSALGVTPAYAGYVVGFGDSITRGVSASDAAHQWLNIVAAAKNWQLVNSGTDGTVLQNSVQNAVATIGAAAANNGRDTYVERVTAHGPISVLILYGLNDLRLNDAGFSVANFQNDLGEVIDGIVAAGTRAADIVIGSPPYIPAAVYTMYAPWDGGTALKHAAHVAAAAAVASSKGTKYIDVYQWMADNGGNALISGDGIHPNDAGHAAIANAFLSVL